ncbi:porin family protein [Hymenobacter sp. 102]|uniref:porin family protein n=1 Tax=Hymenobacter sp. 102 TaxID=3403152 RepID=UPI003CECB380
MKKALLALVFSGATIGAASAQVEIGLKVSPSISLLRADSPSAYGFQNQKSKVSIGGGIIVDYFFGQNYAFSTGLELTGKGGTISYFDPNAGANGERITQKIGLQYLQVPVTVKLFTNDIATDTKLYFQLGGSLNAAIAGRINGDKRYTDPGNRQETKAAKHVIIPDAALRGGFGVEYQLGQSTKVLAGFSYHRGLFNIDNYFGDERNFKDVELKNSEFALDLGLKF